MKKKILMILFIALIIIYIFFIFLNCYSNQILIIGGNTIIQYRNNKILKIKKMSRVNKKLNYEKYSVYNENSVFEDYYIEFNNSEYNNDIAYVLYNNSDEEVTLSNPLLAYTNNLNIKVAQSKSSYVMTSDDKKVLQNKMNGYDLNNIYFNKVTFDIDNDGYNEDLYIVNNFDLINVPDRVVSYVFLKKGNDDIIDLVNFESSNQSKVPAYRFCYAADIDNDNVYEIILSNFYNESKINYNIYKYDLESNKVNELK